MTPKQRDFCRHYVGSESVTAAAIAAGYSPHYAKSAASRKLLQNPDVIAEIKRIRSRLNETADKSATDVVNEYARIAFADRVSFLKEDPHYTGEFIYKAPNELTDEQRAIVEKVNMRSREIKVQNEETGEITELVRQEYTYILSDKANALQQMGRHFGIFDDKLKLIGSQQNPFKNATPAQLEKLKESFVGVMTDPKLIEDAEYTEVNNG